MSSRSRSSRGPPSTTGLARLVPDGTHVNDLSCETTSGRWCTPLARAVESGDLEGVRTLLAGGADTSICDDELDTPVHYTSASADGPRLLRLLLDSRPDDAGLVNLQNSSGRTALHTSQSKALPCTCPHQAAGFINR